MGGKGVLRQWRGQRNRWEGRRKGVVEVSLGTPVVRTVIIAERLEVAIKLMVRNATKS
jgi:hypothetical protein